MHRIGNKTQSVPRSMVVGEGQEERPLFRAMKVQVGKRVNAKRIVAQQGTSVKQKGNRNWRSQT